VPFCQRFEVGEIVGRQSKRKNSIQTAFDKASAGDWYCEDLEILVCSYSVRV